MSLQTPPRPQLWLRLEFLHSSLSGKHGSAGKISFLSGNCVGGARKRRHKVTSLIVSVVLGRPCCVTERQGAKVVPITPVSGRKRQRYSLVGLYKPPEFVRSTKISHRLRRNGVLLHGNAAVQVRSSGHCKAPRSPRDILASRVLAERSCLAGPRLGIGLTLWMYSAKLNCTSLSVTRIWAPQQSTACMVLPTSMLFVVRNLNLLRKVFSTSANFMGHPHALHTEKHSLPSRSVAASAPSNDKTTRVWTGQ